MFTLLTQVTTTLMAHRLRSILAVFSIVVGIVSVLVLVALGEGFYQMNITEFSSRATHVQYVYPGYTSKVWKGLPEKREMSFTQDDVDLLNTLTEIESSTLVYEETNAHIATLNGNRIYASTVGVDVAAMQKNTLQLLAGSRKFHQLDMQLHQRVAILGSEVALYSDLSIGQTISISHYPFIVVGIIAPNESNLAVNDTDNQILIPTTAFLDIWDVKPTSISITPKASASYNQVKTVVVNRLSKLKRFDPEDNEAIFMPDSSADAQFVKLLLRGIQAFLGLCGAMTLVVGSIGVVNIMFLSVTERTREIGLRLAIGATPNKILIQFLMEGFMIVFMGAILGVLSAFGMVELVNKIGLPSWLGVAQISHASIVIVLGLTFLMAFFVVSFPARRAASFTPIAALSAR